METLIKVRKGERITELTREIVSSPDITYLTVELKERRGNILIVVNHSDEIVKTVLNEINPEDSGYIFFASELLLDPLNNCMVPKHRTATSKEIDRLLHNKIPLEKLPIIRMIDPVRRWHNFPRGSTIAIERADNELYFRRVV